MIVIGIVGKKESGKSTLADALQEHLFDLGQIVIRASFAKALKDMLVNVGLCQPKHVYGRKTKSSRFFLQCVGTEIVRKVDPNYWCQQVWDKLKETYRIEPSSIVIIDDVRFINEWQMLNSLNACMVKIERPNKKQVEDNHRSETEMDQLSPADFIFCNNGTKRDLKRQAMSLATFLLSREDNYSVTKKMFRKENTRLWKS